MEEKMRMESVDMTAQNIDRIATMFPNCITESMDASGKLRKAINFNLLRQMLSGAVEEGDEAYEFTKVGKKAAIVEANKPIRKTLRPCLEESLDWDTTENLYIEGDNLEVLKLLQESYLGKIKLIYIDPPYNTGNDFVYKDSFKDWENMITPRLELSKNLLTKNGVIFISIGEEEVDTLKTICNKENAHSILHCQHDRGRVCYILRNRISSYVYFTRQRQCEGNDYLRQKRK